MLFILNADPSNDHYLGRFDVASLPQQALMELFVRDMETNCRFQSDSGAFMDKCEWWCWRRIL